MITRHFAFLDHHLYAVDQETSSTLPEILLSLMEGFVQGFRKSQANISGSEEIDFRKLSNMTLVICGGIQQDPDYIRLAFGLLQHQLSPDLLNCFTKFPLEFILCQQLNHKTIIINAVGYRLSDETEDMAAQMGKYLCFSIVIYIIAHPLNY